MISAFKRPRALYCYENKKLVKHKLTVDCCPTATLTPQGPRYRCRLDGLGRHDFYGYEHIRYAKAVELIEADQRLYEEQRWIEELKK